jgi:hypothetical protein
MSSNLKVLHTYFYLLQENPQKKSPAKLKEKKRIIELIIKENHFYEPGTERKMRRTLPLGNFQEKKTRRRKKQVQTLPIGRI